MNKKEFLKNNQLLWNKGHGSGKAIYFENITEDYLPYMISKFVTAKGIQETAGGDVFAIKYTVGEDYSEICESFGITPLSVFKRTAFLTYIKIIILTVYLVIRNFATGKLGDYEYKEVQIGELIYDHIIRTSEKITISRVLSFRDIKTVLKGLLVAEFADNEFKDNTPGYYVAADLIYINGIPARYACKYGAKIMVVTSGKRSFVYPKENVSKGYGLYTSVLYRSLVDEQIEKGLTDSWLNVIDTYLENITKGIGDWNIINAYGNKDDKDVSEIIKDLKIDNDKKNIFLMPHCFSDAPHCGAYSLYKDYYSWYVETLKIIGGISNVNWIVKGHPSHAAYGEKGLSYILFKKYKKENMFWFPDGYSTNIVARLADAVITVRGSAGMEMSCQGIRSVLAGDAYYGDRSYSYTAHNKDEYVAILKSMNTVQRLNTRDVEEAKKVLFSALYFLKPIREEYQEIVDKFNEAYRSMWDDVDNVKFDKMKTDFFDDLCKLYKQRSIKESYWYVWGRENA